MQTILFVTVCVRGRPPLSGVSYTDTYKSKLRLLNCPRLQEVEPFQ